MLWGGDDSLGFASGMLVFVVIRRARRAGFQGEAKSARGT